MSFRLLTGLIMATMLSQCNNTKTPVFNLKEHTPFAVCYAKVSPEQVQPYRMVIVEPDFYSREEIDALRAAGTKIIAYITLGEVDENRWYYPLLQEHGFLGKNENWNSSYINIKKNEVRQIILAQVVTEINSKGIDGFFLDTIDAVSPETDRGHLSPYMVELIEGIRARHPNKIIIQNAGLFLLDETKDDINAFLTEALASDYDFSTMEYKIRSDEEYNQRLYYLDQYVQESKKPFLVLDFAKTPEQRKQIAARLDTLGRPYFISNIGLSKIPADPDSVANDLRAGIK